MISLKDQLGRVVTVASPAKAIISLVPSLTDLLAWIQLDEAVVGLTKFCVHPSDWKKNKLIVGGTKKIHLDRIERLSPELIIANKEENTEQDIAELEKKFTVYISDIKSLEDCYQCIVDIGILTDRQKETLQLISELKHAFTNIQKFDTIHQVAYCIWKDPWMFAGNDTFINHMLEQAGFSNVIQQSRYPSLTISEILDLKPDLLFLSSEPFPFKEDHIHQLTLKLPNTKIILADGELFSWYGSRLLKFPAYINSLRQKL